MIYCFDIDETICSKVDNSQYEFAKPFLDIIKTINDLYDSGNKIIIMTARGCVSGKDHTELTKKQLQEWKLNYHELIMNKKPHADIFIDDKAMNIEDFKKKFINKRVGIIAGCFDVIHPGYIDMFSEAKEHCSYLIVALQEDPTFERPEKLKPILSLEERKKILLSLKFVDEIISYKTEKELYNILKNTKIDFRILGDDYKEKKFTGDDLKIPVVFINRNHGWSSTKYKNLLRENYDTK